MRYCSSLLALIALAATSCQTSNGPAFNSGMVRTAVSGGWSTTEFDPGGDVDVLALDLSVGTLLTPQIETGGDLVYSDVDAGGLETNSWAILGYGRYYFQVTGPSRVWAQAKAGWEQADIGIADDSTFSWALGAGASQFVTESSALELSAQYGQASFDFGPLGGGDTDISSLSVLLGYAVYY